MTIDAERPTPRSAAMAWWRSMQNQDVGAIERMTLDDYLSAGGPGVRTAGRDELLEGTSRLLASAVIEDWSVTGLEVREHGDVAACWYLWSERGQHQDEEFGLRGVATDVPVFKEDRWRYQAHHVSMSGEEER